MFTVANVLRRTITRILYRVMGLKIALWRSRVDFLWSLSPAERNGQLESELIHSRPMSAAGNVIETLESIGLAPALSKSALKERTEFLSVRGHFGRHTAGTTGTLTNIWLSKDELSRMLAVRDYCFSRYGIRLGDREARVWGRTGSSWKTRLKDCLMNRRVFHPAGRSALDQARQLLTYRPDYIYGYASLILELAKLVEEHGLKVPPIRCVVCTAETILPAQKAYIGKQLKTVVVEEYGSTEFDVIAFECTKGHLHIVNPWLVVEAAGGTVLVSDVSRSTQSLVRYELGDMVKVNELACDDLGGSQVIASLEGRTIDRFAYINEKEKFHAVEFARVINEYCESCQQKLAFTVEQVDYGFFRLYIDSGSAAVSGKELIDHIRASIRTTTGHEIRLELAPGAERLLSAGEKRSYFVGLERHQQSPMEEKGG